ncbi:hypothetical protein P389DRAFT_83907 [Cystobasidium minutum MCA 4210]|uniref:uncharacterized protein n=1 Tax=Cystobasidium minutum MCA 4210 TaxID=1397322 RepID=UPI0034CFE775|eukprot:jgi/Rhomi1/83907/CE83906_110
MVGTSPSGGMPIDDEKVKRMKMFPRSDDFAVLLGFRNSRAGVPPARTEQHKVDILNLLYIPRLLLEHPLQQDVVFSRFCALYLPQLVEHYLKPPSPSSAEEWNKSVALEDMKIANAYGYLLVHLNGNPYFERFFRLPQHREIRKKLIITMLDRLHERAAPWETREADLKNRPTGGISVSSMIYDFCQLLGSLVLFESEENIRTIAEEAHVKRLMYFLDWWDKKYFRPTSKPSNSTKIPIDKSSQLMIDNGDASQERSPPRTLHMLLQNGTSDAELEEIRLARHQKSSIHECGLPGCHAGFAKDGGSLLQCSQCATVRYCCAEHQTLAWKHLQTMHKEMCHKPVY